MRHEKILLSEMYSEEAEKRIKESGIALLPIGSVEQHGIHLPLDTDTYDAYWLSQEVAKRVVSPKPIVCPPVYYGVSYHHFSFGGTITVSPESLISYVYEICISLVKRGIKKIIIINGHGGNTPALNTVAQKVHSETGIFICVSSGEIAGKKGKKIFFTKDDVHAGECETSTSLANRKALVNLKKLKKGIVKFPSEHLKFSKDTYTPWKFNVSEFSKYGVIGDATKASEKKGKKYWTVCIKNLVELIEDLKKWKKDKF